jgi:hypothetical protein
MARIEYPQLVSIADYLAGEETSGAKHEYLGGIVHAMAGGSNRHNTVATNAVISLGFTLPAQPPPEIRNPMAVVETF